MTPRKPLDQQTVVIIGASSGIGRATALKFAQKGSKLVVAARSPLGIETLVEEIKSIQKRDDHVIGMVCDVKNTKQVKAVAEKAQQSFGGINTWVHCASVLEVATVEDVTEDEAMQIMDVNFMGVLRGVWTSLPYLKKTQGSLIIIGSVEGRRAVINHGLYAASKHAVAGLVESLRMELYREKSGVNVTEIIPPTMDTPFYDKARVKVDGGKWKYGGPPLIYKPNVAADCILYAAQYPTKELYVGASASLLTKVQAIVPSLLDKSMIYFGNWMEKTDVPKSSDDNLFAPIDSDTVNKCEGSWNATSFGFSMYNWIVLHMPRLWPFSFY